MNIEDGDNDCDQEDEEERGAGHEVHPALRLVGAISRAECRALGLVLCEGSFSRVGFQKTTLEKRDFLYISTIYPVFISCYYLVCLSL